MRRSKERDLLRKWRIYLVVGEAGREQASSTCEEERRGEKRERERERERVGCLSLSSVCPSSPLRLYSAPKRTRRVRPSPPHSSPSSPPLLQALPPLRERERETLPPLLAERTTGIASPLHLPAGARTLLRRLTMFQAGWTIPQRVSSLGGAPVGLETFPACGRGKEIHRSMRERTPGLPALLWPPTGAASPLREPIATPPRCPASHPRRSLWRKAGDSWNFALRRRLSEGTTGHAPLLRIPGQR